MTRLIDRIMCEGIEIDPWLNVKDPNEIKRRIARSQRLDARSLFPMMNIIGDEGVSIESAEADTPDARYDIFGNRDLWVEFPESKNFKAKGFRSTHGVFLTPNANFMAYAVASDKTSPYIASVAYDQCTRRPKMPQDIAKRVDICNCLAWDFLRRILQFLCCKNAHLVDVHPEEISPSVRKMARKKFGIVDYRIKTIDIIPQGEKRPTGHYTLSAERELPLHITRGHWKDYTQNGLFGKEHLKGWYWWCATVKGKAKNGIVDHDYRIKE